MLRKLKRGTTFWHEIALYCRDDVRILRKSVYEFRKLFMEINIYPFNSITIASACNMFFRENFHHRVICQMMLALKCLVEMGESQKDIAIQHARNGGEHVIMCNNHTYKADGFNIKDRQKTIRIPRMFLPWSSKLLPSRYEKIHYTV